MRSAIAAIVLLAALVGMALPAGSAEPPQGTSPRDAEHPPAEPAPATPDPAVPVGDEAGPVADVDLLDEFDSTEKVDAVESEQPAEQSNEPLGVEPEPEITETSDDLSDVDEASDAAPDPLAADGDGEPAVVGRAADVVVTLNGQPLTDEGNSKLTGCSLTLAATVGAAPEAPREVSLQITAIAPTAPEGAPAALVDEVTSVTTSEWTSVHDMTSLLTDFDPKPNGYRLEVEVTIDDVPAGQKEIWLACGAAQDGSPNRILLAVEWLDSNGVLISQPLDEVVPDADWRSGYSLWATSDRGVAACTYPPESDVLTCNYDNPGHGSKPGLLVPGGKKFTYDIVQIGLPSGWVVDANTIGTFVGRETCPKGGGHDDGHDDHAHAAAHEEGHEDGEPCVHTVRNMQVEPSPPPTEPPTTEPTNTAVVQAATLTTTATAPVGTSELPATGSEVDGLLRTALLTLAAARAPTALRRPTHRSHDLSPQSGKGPHHEAAGPKEARPLDGRHHRRTSPDPAPGDVGRGRRRWRRRVDQHRHGRGRWP